MNKPKSDSANSIEAHLATLFGRINYERQIRVAPRHFKLQNMREVLKRLGNPQLKYPVIHVAGTKGKGSVCTMIGQILSNSGRRTGVYTSPHLEKINQRMAIDGQLISDDQLVQVLSFLDPVVKQMDDEADKQGLRPLTFFEVMTTAALHFFATQECDAVVLEVGLGGRMDSTNVCQPTATIITNISLDHTRQLGSTVDKIAYEKAGIIKPSVPVISGATNPEAATVIKEIAIQNAAPLFQFGHDFQIEPSPQRSETFNYVGHFQIPRNSTTKLSRSSENDTQTNAVDFRITDLELNLLGDHQRANAALAVATVQTLNSLGWKIPEQVIREGLRDATLAGRMEIVCQRPTIIVDIAHNVASINALVNTLQNCLSNWTSSSKRTLLFATSQDKDAFEMLKPLIESFDQVILTKFQENPRGKNELDLLAYGTEIQSSLQNASRHAASLTTAPDPEAAWQRIQRELKEDHLVCISGSVFLVAELRKMILKFGQSSHRLIDA